MEKSRDPGFVSSLPGLSPLSLLQHKLLLGGPQLVPIHDGTGHMLPQSANTVKLDANGGKCVLHTDVVKVSSIFVIVLM